MQIESQITRDYFGFWHEGVDYMASFYNDNSNTFVNGTKSKDYIQNYYGNNVTINSGAGNDTVKNFGEHVTILSGKGNDSVTSQGDSIKIYGGAGNDSIYNSYGENVTISGDSGNDFIYSCGDNVKIDGGKGKDFIINYSEDVTLTGGKGNDTIIIASDYSKNNVIKYVSGDGNDTISGFNSDDTLHITKGSYKVKTSGNDVVVTVGKGKITLKDAKGQKISIKNSKGKVTTKTYGSSSSNVAELFAENNFATANNLSEIVKNNLTATDYKVENQNFETLMKENLITFATK